ncbi:expressed protein [Phakopsora pachyrhizi]|uniref:Expressed protein n=1 Tax=Phakopsora pachyrhizi TaxID=170000 RepID=A0AAV0BT12_PHAPC|nr:expressed protein [Phakopsora pachyrhizi]
MPSIMLSFRLCLFIWLCQSQIFQDRGVQGFFSKVPFAEVGEYHSLDFASRNSRDFFNLQSNVHNNERNHKLSSAYPVNSDFSNHIPREYINWGANVISPLDEWLNHLDSAPNFQEATDFYHRNPWDFAPAEDSSFSGQNHQKQTYPQVGSSQDKKSSYNTIQPIHDGDLFGGNHPNFVPHFDEFRYSDSSFVAQPHQNFVIHHDERMIHYPAFHSFQNDLSFGSQISEIRNKSYKNQGWEVLNFIPVLSYHNSRSLNLGETIDNRRNSIDTENLIVGTSKKSMSEKAQSLAEAEESFREKKYLISILNNDFIRCSRKTALARMSSRSREMDVRYLKSIHEKAVDFMNQHSHKDRQANLRTKANFEKKDVAKINRLRKHVIFEYTLGIEWENSKFIKTAIFEFADKFKNYGNLTKHDGTSAHIAKISFLGIIIMKIIAKKYSHDPLSEVFGSDSNLLHYTESFWNCCFTNKGETNQALRDFFTSFGEKYPEEEIDRFLSTGLIQSCNIPEDIFSRIKTSITSNVDKPLILLFSWYFVLFRAMVYYPHLVFKKGYTPGNKLKTFIEGGIMYCFETGEKAEKKEWH